MKTLWIVVANRGFAKIYESKGHGHEIKEIYNVDNPDGKKKSGDLMADRPGRSFDSKGVGRHALSTEVSPTAHEQQVFAKKIVNVLQEANGAKAFDELAIVAPPHFLGALKLHLPDAIVKKVTKEIGKDLPEYINEHERIEQLCKYLDLWNHEKIS